MDCDACGTKNDGGSTTCRVCGLALGDESRDVPAGDPSSAESRGASIAAAATSGHVGVAEASVAEGREAGKLRRRVVDPARSARRRRPRMEVAASIDATLRAIVGDTRRRELLLLVAVIVAALAVRVWALGAVPPYLTTDETRTLAAAFQIASAWGPGLFGLDWRGLPALDSYAIALFVAFLGNSAISVRLVSAVAGTVTLVPFYVLARRSLDRWPALGATIVLGSGFWLLTLSRTGTDDIWPVVVLVCGLWTVHEAMGRGPLRWWCAAGLWSALGLYGPPPGHLVIIVVTTLAIAWTLLFGPRGRVARQSDASVKLVRRRLVRLELLLCVALVLFVPQVPASFDATAAPGANQAASVGAAAIPWIGGALFWSAPLTWLGLSPPAVPFLDVLTTFFAAIGFATAWRKGGTSLLWYVTLGLCLAFGWIVVRETPDSTWGALALVPVAAFAGFGFDAVLTAVPIAFEAPLRPLAAVAALVIAAVNVWGYAAWSSLPASALPLAPVLPMAQYPAWRQDAVRLAATGTDPPALTDWLAHAPPAPVPVAASPVAQPAPASKEPVPLARVAPTVTATFERNLTGPESDRWVTPRGIAVDRQGTVYVADPGAHVVHRLDAQGGALSPLAIDAQSAAQPWALAITADGALLVDDAEAGILYTQSSGQPTVRLGTLHFGKPRGVSVGTDGAVLVAETAGNRIVVLSPNGQQLGQITSGQGGPPTLDQPTDVAQGSDGNFVVAEPNARRLEKIAPNGDYLGAWTFPVSDTFNAPHIAVLPDGVAVTDPNEHQVLVLDTAMRVVGVIGSSGSGDGQFATPTFIAADPSGTTLYCVDSGLNRVAVFKLTRQ